MQRAFSSNPGSIPGGGVSLLDEETRKFLMGDLREGGFPARQLCLVNAAFAH